MWLFRRSSKNFIFENSLTAPRIAHLVFVGKKTARYSVSKAAKRNCKNPSFRFISWDLCVSLIVNKINFADRENPAA
jgi:hypothetical protein